VKQLLRHFYEWTVVRLGRVPDCDWVQDRLPAYCDFDLSFAELYAIEKHLAGCRTCAAEHVWVSQICDMLMEAYPHPALRDFDARAAADKVMAAVRAEEASRPASIPPSLAWPRLAIACACAALVCVCGWLALHRDGSAKSDITERGRADADDTMAGAEHLVLPANEELELSLCVAQSTYGYPLPVAERLRACTPCTADKLDSWARKEYPHILWLHGVLQEEFGCRAPWRSLLRQSPALLRFGYPDAPEDTNCFLTWADVATTARTAGFLLTPDANGAWVSPDLAWQDRVPGAIRVNIARCDALRPSPVALSAMPDHYEQSVVSSVELAASVLPHIATSACLLNTPESGQVTRAALHLLAEVLSLEDQPECAPAAHMSSEAKRLLEAYRALAE